MIWLKCLICSRKVDYDSFKDKMSVKEYFISGMCQICQDKVWKRENVGI